MSILRRMFPTTADLNEARRELKKAENTVERRDKRIETLEAEVKSLKLRFSDYRFYEESDQGRLTRAHETEVEKIRDEADRKVRNAQADAKHTGDVFDSKLELAEERAGVKARKEVEEEISGLEKELRTALVSSAENESLAKERSESIQRLVEENKQLRAIITEVLTKIPDVNLENFNINVEVPPATVEVVTQGGGKKK